MSSIVKTLWGQLVLKLLAREYCAVKAEVNPFFRNDDVCWDTPYESFHDFCEIFWKYGLHQLHGVTLKGKTMTVADTDGNSAGPYRGYSDLCDLPNDTIRRLSDDFPFADRSDIIDFLRSSSDDIALHGLYHTDYSHMTTAEQRRDIGDGLNLLRSLFPEKDIRFFIAPFNKTSPETYIICREFGLKVLAGEGIHLEENLTKLFLYPGTWYRYHHHRFYPCSAFDYYELSLEKLDVALSNATKRAQP